MQYREGRAERRPVPVGAQIRRGVGPARLLWLAICLALVGGVVVACGRSDSGSAPAAGPRVIPTMPPARFAQPTTMIGAAPAVPPAETTPDAEATLEPDATVAPEEEAAVAPATPAPAAPAADLERGANIYRMRGCDECHGAEAQGIPGEGSALAGLTMPESRFTAILRTGDSGRLGSGHLYGPSAISPGGMSALYAWLQSLEQD